MRLVIAPFPLVYGSDIQANPPNQVPFRPLGLEPESAGENSPRCAQDGCAILSCTHACAGGVGSNSSKVVGTSRTQTSVRVEPRFDGGATALASAVQHD